MKKVTRLQTGEERKRAQVLAELDRAVELLKELDGEDPLTDIAIVTVSASGDATTHYAGGNTLVTIGALDALRYKLVSNLG